MPSGNTTRSEVSSAAASAPSARTSAFQESTPKLKYLKKPSSERFDITEATSAARWIRLREPPGTRARISRPNGHQRSVACTSPAYQSMAVSYTHLTLPTSDLV